MVEMDSTYLSLVQFTASTRYRENYSMPTTCHAASMSAASSPHGQSAAYDNGLEKVRQRKRQYAFTTEFDPPEGVDRNAVRLLVCHTAIIRNVTELERC
jgi:hypothetical protein